MNAHSEENIVLSKTFDNILHLAAFILLLLTVEARRDAVFEQAVFLSRQVLADGHQLRLSNAINVDCEIVDSYLVFESVVVRVIAFFRITLYAVLIAVVAVSDAIGKAT